MYIENNIKNYSAIVYYVAYFFLNSEKTFTRNWFCANNVLYKQMQKKFSN